MDNATAAAELIAFARANIDVLATQEEKDYLESCCVQLEQPNEALAKPFVVFKGNDYYSYGGWADGGVGFATQAEAEAYLEAQLSNQPTSWGQVVDLQLGTIVYTIDTNSIGLP